MAWNGRKQDGRPSHFVLDFGWYLFSSLFSNTKWNEVFWEDLKVVIPFSLHWKSISEANMLTWQDFWEIFLEKANFSHQTHPISFNSSWFTSNCCSDDLSTSNTHHFNPHFLHLKLQKPMFEFLRHAECQLHFCWYGSFSFQAATRLDPASWLPTFVFLFFWQHNWISLFI